jgi:hypothetical protein
MPNIDEIRKDVQTKRPMFRTPLPTCGHIDRCEFCYNKIIDECYYINLPIVECYICKECHKNMENILRVVMVKKK